MTHPVNDWLKQEGRRKSWLAGEVGISEVHLNRLIRGEGEFTTGVFDKLGAAMSVPAEDLFADFMERRRERRAQVKASKAKARRIRAEVAETKKRIKRIRAEA